MGTKAKMSNVVGVAFPLIIGISTIIGIAGCKQMVIPPASIEVEQTDTENWTGVTIYYQNHSLDPNGPTYIILNSSEEIRAYKEKVEFLLSRLEEAELRMGVHEDIPIE